MTTINRYELTSSKLQEDIFIEYTNGQLSAVVLPIKYPLKEVSFKALMGTLPMKEDDLSVLADIKLKVTREIPSNIKIAMFCQKYMQYHNMEKYKVTPAETKRIKDFKITNEILDHFFTTTHFYFAGRHSIFTLTKYYNELIIDFNNKGKKIYPNSYSAEYANKLSPAELPGYWKHLSSLGLEPKKNQIGALMDWVKKV